MDLYSGNKIPAVLFSVPFQTIPNTEFAFFTAAAAELTPSVTALPSLQGLLPQESHPGWDLYQHICKVRVSLLQKRITLLTFLLKNF